MKINDEIIIHKPVYDAIWTYMKNDDNYAGMHLSEFLDKMFAPKDTCITK
jgi:hypothetical protein